ncbi:MAG: nuclear transport factor 2 family protein [Acidimicrobiales bacterium]
MTVAEENVRLTERLWNAIASQDSQTLSSLFHDDAEYTDAATPEDDVARGGAEVVLRLGLAFDGVEISTSSRKVVANNDVVMVERVERWTWRTGEHVALPIASVVEIREGKISRWVDYWDMQTLLGVAPGWWIEQVMKGWKN